MKTFAEGLRSIAPRVATMVLLLLCTNLVMADIYGVAVTFGRDDVAEVVWEDVFVAGVSATAKKSIVYDAQVALYEINDSRYIEFLIEAKFRIRCPIPQKMWATVIQVHLPPTDGCLKTLNEYLNKAAPIARAEVIATCSGRFQGKDNFIGPVGILAPERGRGHGWVRWLVPSPVHCVGQKAVVWGKLKHSN